MKKLWTISVFLLIGCLSASVSSSEENVIADKTPKKEPKDKSKQHDKKRNPKSSQGKRRE